LSETQTDPAAYEDTATDTEAFAPEPEAPPPAETAEAAPQPKQSVPLAVLMEEREATKRERAERMRLQEQMERGNERLQQLLHQFQPPQQPREPVPDINTDPVGFFKAQLDATQRELAEVKQFRDQSAQQSQAQHQQQQFLASYQADAAQFAQRAPDFGEAYNHVTQSLLQDYMEAGYSVQEARAELQEQERKIAERAFRDGRSPAEAIYKLAKSRGFSAKSPPAEARIDAMQRGQQVARSTAGGNTRAAGDGMTFAELANMPSDQFDALYRKNPALVDKLMRSGG
jgi:DNA-binding ferritin-like protein